SSIQPLGGVTTALSQKHICCFSRQTVPYPFNSAALAWNAAAQPNAIIKMERRAKALKWYLEIIATLLYQAAGSLRYGNVTACNPLVCRPGERFTPANRPRRPHCVKKRCSA